MYLALIVIAATVIFFMRVARKSSVKPSYMPELSHPVINYAQEVANRTRKIQLIVPNSLGGFDVVPAERITLEVNCNFAGTVRPQPFTGAMKCFSETNTILEI